MTILVTGGAGFIGANFVISWIRSRGTPVVNLDKLTYARIHGNNSASLSWSNEVLSLAFDSRG